MNIVTSCFLQQSLLRMLWPDRTTKAQPNRETRRVSFSNSLGKDPCLGKRIMKDLQKLQETGVTLFFSPTSLTCTKDRNQGVRRPARGKPALLDSSAAIASGPPPPPPTFCTRGSENQNELCKKHVHLLLLTWHDPTDEEALEHIALGLQLESCLFVSRCEISVSSTGQAQSPKVHDAHVCENIRTLYRLCHTSSSIDSSKCIRRWSEKHCDFALIPTFLCSTSSIVCTMPCAKNRRLCIHSCPI